MIIDSGRAEERRILDAMRVGIREYPRPELGRIGAYSSGHTELVRLIEPMMLELRTYLLTDKLGEERIVEEHVEDHECLRFATWFDHWKATYQGRWWMRWRRWKVRYNIMHRPLRARVEVDMTRYWTFPEADIVPAELGRPMPYVVNKQRPSVYGYEPPHWTFEEREGGQE